MQGLSAAIPDPAVLLALEPEELGAKMLFILRTAGSGKFHPGNMLGDLWRGSRPSILSTRARARDHDCGDGGVGVARSSRTDHPRAWIQWTKRMAPTESTSDEI